MKKTVEHLELLDYTRGVAILAVLVFHTFGMAFGYDALPWKGCWRDFGVQSSFLYFLPIGMLAQSGVAIFFVVSGFCIHLSFQQQGKRWGGFFIRRFFRIYPAYFLALVFALLILATGSKLDYFGWEFWKQLLTHVFLVHNFDADTVFGFNASLWSLAVEAQLYLLYPVLLFLVARAGWRRAMVMLAVCELLIRSLDGTMQTMDATNTLGGQIVWVLANLPFGCWFSWALGTFIAEAWLNNEPLPFRNASPLLWLGLALACYFAKPLYVFQFLLFAVATAVMTSRCLTTGHVGDKMSASAMKVLKHAGLWSYSIYLLHQPLLHVYSHIVVWAVPGEYRPAPVAFLLMAATWLMIIPFSVLWYKRVEVPGIAVGKNLLKSVQPGPQGPAGVKTARGLAANVRESRAAKAGQSLQIAGLVIFVAASLMISDRFSYRTAVKNSNRAWELATSPDAAKRNGTLAVELAEDACMQTHYRETVMVSTLAAAYAEAGRFDEAIGAAQMACSLAAQSGDQKSLQKNKELLAHYLRHEPYHEPPAGGTNEPGAPGRNLAPAPSR